jgi:hypothetical protein
VSSSISSSLDFPPPLAVFAALREPIDEQLEDLADVGNLGQRRKHRAHDRGALVQKRARGHAKARRHRPQELTLVASNATDADAYCTAVSVMEPAQGLAFVESHPELEAVIIGPDDALYVSKGLRDRFVDERD